MLIARDIVQLSVTSKGSTIFTKITTVARFRFVPLVESRFLYWQTVNSHPLTFVVNIIEANKSFPLFCFSEILGQDISLVFRIHDGQLSSFPLADTLSAIPSVLIVLVKLVVTDLWSVSVMYVKWQSSLR